MKKSRQPLCWIGIDSTSPPTRAVELQVYISVGLLARGIWPTGTPSPFDIERVEYGSVVSAYSSGAATAFHRLPYYPDSGPKYVIVVIIPHTQRRVNKKPRLSGVL
jgi:hypothetical protein